MKKIKKQLKYSLKEGCKMLVLVLFGVFIAYLGLSIVQPIDLRNFYISTQYRLASSYEENHKFINDTASLCNFDNKLLQVDCVVDIVHNYYNYSINRTSNRVIQTTEEYITSPSLCRDIAVTYDKIFRQLGWGTAFTFVPHHVYLTISKYNQQNGEVFYCTVDSLYYDCTKG